MYRQTTIRRIKPPPTSSKYVNQFSISGLQACQCTWGNGETDPVQLIFFINRSLPLSIRSPINPVTNEPVDSTLAWPSLNLHARPHHRNLAISPTAPPVHPLAQTNEPESCLCVKYISCRPILNPRYVQQSHDRFALHYRKRVAIFIVVMSIVMAGVVDWTKYPDTVDYRIARIARWYGYGAASHPAPLPGEKQSDRIKRFLGRLQFSGMPMQAGQFAGRALSRQVPAAGLEEVLLKGSFDKDGEITVDAFNPEAVDLTTQSDTDTTLFMTFAADLTAIYPG